MSNTILLGGLAFVMDALFAPAQQSAPSPIKPIETDALEHGVYYIGRFRGETAIARWHAAKGRFVHAEYSLGRQRVRMLAHAASGDAREGFCPLSPTSPKDNQRISDYAFETAS